MSIHMENRSDSRSRSIMIDVKIWHDVASPLSKFHAVPAGTTRREERELGGHQPQETTDDRNSTPYPPARRGEKRESSEVISRERRLMTEIPRRTRRHDGERRERARRGLIPKRGPRILQRAFRRVEVVLKIAGTPTILQIAPSVVVA